MTRSCGFAFSLLRVGGVLWGTQIDEAFSEEASQSSRRR